MAAGFLRPQEQALTPHLIGPGPPGQFPFDELAVNSLVALHRSDRTLYQPSHSTHMHSTGGLFRLCMGAGAGLSANFLHVYFQSVKPIKQDTSSKYSSQWPAYVLHEWSSDFRGSY